MRVYGMVAIVVGIVLIAIRVAGAGLEHDARDLASREFQSATSAVAAGVSARVATIQASLSSADALVPANGDLSGLCEAMSRDPRRPYQRLYAFTPGANLRCTTVPETRDQPEVIRARSYFQAALATGEDQVGGPLVGTFSGRPSLVFAHPVRSGGNIVGVVVAAMDAVEVVQPTLGATPHERMMVLGRDGGQFEVGITGEVQPPPPQVVQAVGRVGATGDVCGVIVVDGVAWTCSAAGRSGLTAVVGHPEESVFALVLDTVERQKYRSLGMVIVGLGSLLLVEMLFLRRMRGAYAKAGLDGLTAGDTLNLDEIDALSTWAEATESNLRRLRDDVEGNERRRRSADRDLLTSIAETVEVRYPFLRNHGDRVGRYARQIGSRLGVQGEDLELLEFAARIHDLGKIAIADAVYLKPARLDPIESAAMQLHAARGGEMAARLRTVPSQVADAIRHHHERWDGGGYPEGLAGTAIPLWSRIISVADAYDAMTEDRPYRDQPRSHDEAIEILREGAGAQWDSTAVYAFLEVVESGGIIPKPSPPIALHRRSGTNP